MSTDDQLAALRRHVESNYTTDAREEIAWAVQRIQWLETYVKACDNEIKRAYARTAPDVPDAGPFDDIECYHCGPKEVAAGRCKCEREKCR